MSPITKLTRMLPRPIDKAPRENNVQLPLGRRMHGADGEARPLDGQNDQPPSSRRALGSNLGRSCRPPRRRDRLPAAEKRMG
jgi:hypothetical protein